MGCYRVLLIEPDPAIRSALKDGLEDEQIEFCAAADASAAKELLLGGCSPSLVLLDISHPIAQSAPVVQLLRTDPALRGVPVIITSTLPTYMLPVRTDLLFEKPYDLDELLQAIRSVMEEVRSGRSHDAHPISLPDRSA